MSLITNIKRAECAQRAAVIEVERFGALAVVTRDGVEVWGPGPIAQAENKRDTLERQARRKRRKCMTCNDQFMSEGAQHRMCAKCRSGASAIFDGAV